MRAAIYSRFSTDKQTESSIADQVRVCTEYAEKNGMSIAQGFEDQGISGAAIGNRPGCVAMLEAARARTFDVLLVMDTSRLSRSSADLSKIADRLVFMGLRIVAVQEPGADTSKDGWEIYFGLSGLMGQQFRKMTAKKTHTALESRAKGGKHTGGRTYGYTSAQKADGAHVDYAPVAEEAAIVAEVFERYAGGESQHAIAEDLNRRGVPTTGGKPWKVSALHAMLHNERYIGRLIWNRTLWRKDPDSGKRICLERPESEWVRHTDERLRLVSDATWERVRGRDAPVGSSNARPKYPLSGLLLCGECGAPMTICGGINARGYGSHRYVCRTYHEHGKAAASGCSNDMSVSRAVAEELLIEPLRARLLADPDFLTALRRLEATRPDPWAAPPEPAQTPRGIVPDDSELTAKLAAIRAAEAAGAMSRPRCRVALRATARRT